MPSTRLCLFAPALIALGCHCTIALAQPAPSAYLEAYEASLTEAVEQRDLDQFEETADKLIAALYADPRSESHQRTGMLIVKFGIERAIPHLVARIDKTDSLLSRSLPEAYPLTAALVAFGRVAVPAILEEPGRRKLDAYRGKMLGVVLVGIVGAEEALKLVDAHIASLQAPSAREGLNFIRAYLVEAGPSSVMLRVDRSKWPVPPKEPLLPGVAKVTQASPDELDEVMRSVSGPRSGAGETQEPAIVDEGPLPGWALGMIAGAVVVCCVVVLRRRVRR